jgi:hypothetical protein
MYGQTKWRNRVTRTRISARVRLRVTLNYLSKTEAQQCHLLPGTDFLHISEKDWHNGWCFSRQPVFLRAL